MTTSIAFAAWSRAREIRRRGETPLAGIVQVARKCRAVEFAPIARYALAGYRKDRLEIFGAGEGIRTLDPDLGKVVRAQNHLQRTRHVRLERASNMS